MLSNYFKIAYRSLRRHAGYAFVNVFGLAVGLAVCLIVGVFVRHELSFDRFLPNSERVFQAYTMRFGLADAMREQFPQITSLTSVGPYGGVSIFEPEGSEERFHRIQGVFATDPFFLDVFPYRIVRGNSETALDNEDSIVLTESLARRLFPDEDPIGRTIMYAGRRTLTVTAVSEDPPTHAHFRFSALISSGPPKSDGVIRWRAYGVHKIYFELHPEHSPESMQSAITAFVEEQTPDYETAISIRPVTDIHLYSGGDDVIAPQSDIRYLYLFAGVGLLVLLIACANYINMATARAMTRTREIGMRKVMGASRLQLVRQLLGESILTAVLALPFAVILADIAFPLINEISGQELGLSVVTDATGITMLLGITLVTGLAAGFYPALVIARSGPRISIDLGNVRIGGHGFRRVLITGQFAATFFLIMATAVMGLQRQFVADQNLGFDQEHVISTSSFSGTQQYRAFKEELRGESSVRAVSLGPVLGLGMSYMVVGFPDPETGEDVTVVAFDVDYDYAESVGLEMQSGRFYSSDILSDSTGSLVMNAEAARILGLENGEAPGLVDFVGGTHRVIGVTNDFHNSSLHSEVEPIVFRLNGESFGRIIVRLSPGDLSENLAAVQSAWNRVVPDQPFIYQFVDDQIAAQYESEARLASLFGLFSLLAILIACLGLLGLAAFMATRRTKEIGIRKVLGATMANIVSLMSMEFVRLLALAFVLILPVVVLVSNRWLDNFAYRIDMPWTVFLVVGAGMLAVMLFTVGIQAVRSANANPVDSLRYE